MASYRLSDLALADLDRLYEHGIHEKVMTAEEKYCNPSDTLAIGEAPPALPRPVENATHGSQSLRGGFRPKLGARVRLL